MAGTCPAYQLRRWKIMAYGEIEISGNDVLEALTFRNPAAGYQLELTDTGKDLADLLADHIIARLKLSATIKEES